MVGHGGSSAGLYLADPTSPIPSHCASIVVTSTVRVNIFLKSYFDQLHLFLKMDFSCIIPFLLLSLLADIHSFDPLFEFT